MSRYSLSHLSDPTLLHALHSLVAQDRATTADLLAHLAEVDERKLYLPAAYPSMYDYCVGELRLSEQSALKRIRVARVACHFPAVFTMVAEGRLHLSAVIVLSSYLTPENADDLLGAAAGKTKSEVEQLLAERFPRSESFALVAEVSPGGDESLSPGRVAHDAERVAPARFDPATPRSNASPIAPERYSLQLTIAKSTHDKLRHAQALLGHSVPAGEVAEVLDRALDVLITVLERRKLAATARPGPHRPSFDPRHIPAAVRRAVWQRDGGQCTFVSESGHRCPARERLEFDHAEPVARGGRTTVANLRLRCRAHNQYEAERAFGAGFMSRKHREAAEARARRAESAEPAPAAERDQAATERERATAEVVPFLRQLGFRADEARRAAEVSGSRAEASLEERIRLALSSLAPPARRWNPAMAARP